jgi:hypothetical protein
VLTYVARGNLLCYITADFVGEGAPRRTNSLGCANRARLSG